MSVNYVNLLQSGFKDVAEVRNRIISLETKIENLENKLECFV